MVNLLHIAYANVTVKICFINGKYITYCLSQCDRQRLPFHMAHGTSLSYNVLCDSVCHNFKLSMHYSAAQV